MPTASHKTTINLWSLPWKSHGAVKKTTMDEDEWESASNFCFNGEAVRGAGILDSVGLGKTCLEGRTQGERFRNLYWSHPYLSSEKGKPENSRRAPSQISQIIPVLCLHAASGPRRPHVPVELRVAPPAASRAS